MLFPHFAHGHALHHRRNVRLHILHLYNVYIYKLAQTWEAVLAYGEKVSGYWQKVAVVLDAGGGVVCGD